jgi:hypothetical protein
VAGCLAGPLEHKLQRGPSNLVPGRAIAAQLEMLGGCHACFRIGQAGFGIGPARLAFFWPNFGVCPDGLATPYR